MPATMPVDQSFANAQARIAIPTFLDVLESRGYTAKNAAEEAELVRIGGIVMAEPAPAEESRYGQALQLTEKAAGLSSQPAGQTYDDGVIKAAAQNLLTDPVVRQSIESIATAEATLYLQQQAG